MAPGSGHLGSHVSALLDGQLPDEQADRAWRHVATCDSCASAVTREEWVKRRLTVLTDSAPPAELTAVLAGLPVGGAPSGHWPEPVRRGMATRLTVAAIGVGSFSAALVMLGSGYLADGTVEHRDPSAPAWTQPVDSWIADLSAEPTAVGRGPTAHRAGQHWARMEP